MENKISLDQELEGFVQELLNSGRLDAKEAGISKQFLDRGHESLSSKQKYVFEKMIRNNSIRECRRCGCGVPLCEMMEALDNGGYCSWCHHMMEKDKEDDVRFDEAS